MNHCRLDQNVCCCIAGAVCYWLLQALHRLCWYLSPHPPVCCYAFVSAWLPQAADGLCLCPHLSLLDAASCVVQGEPAERAVSVPLLYLQHPTAAVSNAAHSLISAILQQLPQVEQLFSVSLAPLLFLFLGLPELYCGLLSCCISL